MRKKIDNKTMDKRVDELIDHIVREKGYCEVTWNHPQLFGKKPINYKMTVPFSGHRNMTSTLLKSRIMLPERYYSSIRSLKYYLYENEYSHEHIDTIFQAINDNTDSVHLRTNVEKVFVPDYFPSHFHESIKKQSFYIPNISDACQYVSRNILSIIRE